MNWPRSGPAAAPTRAATVTGAQPGVVTVRTGRGLASVPPWRPAVGMPRTARVMLARPLGTRVILDIASGLPLVSEFQIP